MTQAGPLRWRTGAGWLILGGGGRWQQGETGAIDSVALGWAPIGQPIAVLLPGHASVLEGERLLEYYADLGGADGYIVPLRSTVDASRGITYELVAQAGLIHLGDGVDPYWLARTLQGSVALEALGVAFEQGATILAQGTSAIAFGAWILPDRGASADIPGLGWLPDAIIEPNFHDALSAARLRRSLTLHPHCLGIGIPRTTALALGPDGRVETIGGGQITVLIRFESQNAGGHGVGEPNRT